MIDRETTAFLDELDRIAQDLPLQEAIIECFVRGMAMMREIPCSAGWPRPSRR